MNRLPLASAAALALMAARPALSDPCGMVPPIRVAGQPPGEIERIGTQRTYVTFAEGMETIALRPGFQGTVDQFGMLIPFPTAPSITKLPDEAFAHLETALAPPTVRVSIREHLPRPSSRSRSTAGGRKDSAPEAMASLGYNEVSVVREEAVGMYQVAVLEAGSPKALARWMEDNGYRYPQGMDAVVGEYVSARWCFVAVKAKVASGPGVEARPGMRQATPDRPAGSSFDGYVQGMAFRFKVDAPVVPMRLSVFNGEAPRNVVYMLTEGPVRIDAVDTGLVKQQLDGATLRRTLTEPLALEITGGTLGDLRDEERKQVEEARAPGPRMGVARDLIASDMLAARTGQLSLPQEAEEKELLNISEALGLRGPEVDRLHAAAVAAAKEDAVAGALDALDGLTMTVVDGHIPEDHLAAQNLSFSTWALPEGVSRTRTDELRASDVRLTFYKR